MEDVETFRSDLMAEIKKVRNDLQEVKEMIKSLKLSQGSTVNEAVSAGYEIEFLIGKGAKGTVSQVRDTETDEEYAMKVVSLDKNVLPQDLAREISALYEMDHDNIIKLEKVFPSTHELSLIMELVDQDLSAVMILHLGDTENLEMIKDLARQLLSAIEYLHNKGYAHRDLKPQNILVDSTTLRLKLADFGSVRRIYEDTNLSPQVTTLEYRAPEILVGGTSYGKAVDMWSVGCILAEMVEGKTMFGNGDETDTEISILRDIYKKLGTPDKSINYPTFEEEYPTATEISSKLDTIGNDLLMKLLTVDPASRITAKDALEHPFLRKT